VIYIVNTTGTWRDIYWCSSAAYCVDSATGYNITVPP